MRSHIIAAPLALIAFSSIAAAATTCESLSTLALAGATINSAEAVPAGSFTPPAGQPIKDLPAFCRVAGVIKPASDSNIQFEVWMPSSGWNGKFQGIGNGGFAGSISFGQSGSSNDNRIGPGRAHRTPACRKIGFALRFISEATS